MKVRSPIARKKAPPPSKKPIRKRGAKSRENWLRAYGSKERVEWVRAQRCILGCEERSENAHIETGGMGRKADFVKIVPLCAIGHRELHRIGRESFEAKYGINLASHARQTESRWRARSTDG